MKIFNYSLLFSSFLFIVSCGGGSNSSTEATKNVKSKTDVAVSSTENEKVAENKTMRTCECCNKEFERKKGWAWKATSIYKSETRTFKKKYKAEKSRKGKYCSKGCAINCE